MFGSGKAVAATITSTREMVQQLADKYDAALAEGGAKLANTQLQPRLELMRKILEL